jgi:hypothetical protein
LGIVLLLNKHPELPTRCHTIVNCAWRAAD